MKARYFFQITKLVVKRCHMIQCNCKLIVGYLIEDGMDCIGAINLGYIAVQCTYSLGHLCTYREG